MAMVGSIYALINIHGHLYTEFPTYSILKYHNVTLHLKLLLVSFINFSISYQVHSTIHITHKYYLGYLV